MHCKIHLNPETGEMHSDGDHRVRHWIKERLGGKKVVQKVPMPKPPEDFDDPDQMATYEAALRAHFHLPDEVEILQHNAGLRDRSGSGAPNQNQPSKLP